MGRSFGSVRMDVKTMAERWQRACHDLRGATERECALRLAGMAKLHASACFSSFDDPLEAAIFSVLIELLKEVDHLDVDL